MPMFEAMIRALLQKLIFLIYAPITGRYDEAPRQAAALHTRVIPIP